MASANSLAEKLNPGRFTAMSGKMAALVAYVLEEHWTNPAIAELVISSDGFVLAREAGDVGCNDFIGSAEDLERNVRNLLDAAELLPEEADAWHSRYRLRVTDFRNG